MTESMKSGLRILLWSTFAVILLSVIVASNGYKGDIGYCPKTDTTTLVYKLQMAKP